MRRHRIAAYLAAGALLAAISPRDALASIRKCENPTLLALDEGRLFETVRLVLPPRVQPVLADRCRWSDSAFAWITTKKITDADGVTRWWISSCARDRVHWTCDPAVLQQEFEARFIIADIAHHVKISFDRETSPAIAKTLVSQALESYVSPTPPFPYAGRRQVKNRSGEFCGMVTPCPPGMRQSMSPSTRTEGRRRRCGSVISCRRTTPRSASNCRSAPGKSRSHAGSFGSPETRMRSVGRISQRPAPERWRVRHGRLTASGATMRGL